MSDLPKAESLCWHKIDTVLPPEDGVYWIRLWRDGSIFETRAGYDRTMEQFFLYGSFLTEVMSWAHYPLEADGLDDSDEFSGRNAIVAELRHEIRDTQGVAAANIQRAEAAEARVAELAETLENIICAIGLSPVSDGLTEPLIIGVIAAMQQRMTELEAALDAEREAHAWRPVSEEPASGKYFVRTRDGTITTDLFLFGDWLVLSGMVTHYMPMPDAPQEPPQ